MSSSALSRSFIDTVWLAEGGQAFSCKTQFFNTLFSQRTCASTGKHSSLSHIFFFNLRGESSSHSEGTLGKHLLGSPAAPNIILHHYTNAALVFPHPGKGLNPSFPPPCPAAAYSLCSATTEDWITMISICLCCSSDLGFASFCHRMYLFQLYVWGSLCSSLQTPVFYLFKFNLPAKLEKTLELLTKSKQPISPHSRNIPVVYWNSSSFRSNKTY